MRSYKLFGVEERITRIENKMQNELNELEGERGRKRERIQETHKKKRVKSHNAVF